MDALPDGMLRCMLGRNQETPLHRELRAIQELEEWTRAQLYAIPPGRRRDPTAAIAASAAERTYRLTDRLPDWQNATSATWRINLGLVWEFLAGDRSRHYDLSRAVADFMVSPLNHIEGQDGPDDFDRPQTVAAYSAALSVINGGVDFATTALAQIFDAIDLTFDDVDDVEARWSDVQGELDAVRRHVTAVVTFNREPRTGFTPALLESLKG